MAKIQRDAYAKRMAIKAGTYVAPPKNLSHKLKWKLLQKRKKIKHLIPITQAENREVIESLN